MDYRTLKRAVQKIDIAKGFKPRVIGKSRFKRDIYALERVLDKGFLTAIIVASVHARENIGSDLVIKMIDSGIFEEVEDFNIIVVPMLNPDGVELSCHGLCSAPKALRQTLLTINGGSRDFSLFKANGLGVDLNNNFDADFKRVTNSFKPSAFGFAGDFAFSEPESLALKDLTEGAQPFITISLHSKGEEIYFNYFQSGERLERDRIIAERFAQSTGYKIKNPEQSSCGGYKDWCVQRLKIPALTIELGSDEWQHPIGVEHLQEIFDRNKNLAKDLKFAYNVFNSR